jgi:hypothetical protein
MPTITQLPVATIVDPADEVLVSQSGTTRSVSVGSLLATTQPAVMAPTGALLGRVSLGAGGPEPITVGTGLALSESALQANGADHASFAPQTTLQATDQAVLNSNGTPMLLSLSMLRGLFSAGANVTISSSGVISYSGGNVASGNAASIAALSQVAALSATDLVAVNQSGTDHAITYANLIDGKTIDQGTPAAVASDTDTVWVGQGSSTMMVQTFAAIWAWIAGHLPGYKQPVVEITTNTTLDGSAHNGRILVVSKPVTLTHSATEGSGFACQIVNVSGGIVTLDAGITTTSGLQTLASGQCADIYALSYSAGSLNIAWVSGPTASPVPSQISGLVVGTVTYNSVALAWSVPVSGGTPTGYVVQYRITGQTAWTTQTVAVSNTILYGLTAGTEYDIEVLAYNAGGFGPASSLANVTTSAAPSAPPGSPTALVTSAPSASTIALNWTTPTTGGPVGSYTAQYRVTGQSLWITAATNIQTTQVTVGNLTASTEYDFQVIAVNSAGSSSPSTVANGTTTIVAPGIPTAVSVGAITQTATTVSWTAPSTGGAVTSYTLQYRVTGAGSWIQITGITITSSTITGLTAGTQYDFQVEAVNSGGVSGFTPITNATTLVAAPALPTGLTAETATSTTQPLSWTAPTTGGTITSYSVRYSAHAANVWTTVTGITTTATAITGLVGSTSYDYEVEAVNAGGNSGWTAATTATTAVPPNYLLTAYAPAAGYTEAHGTNGIIAQVNDNSASQDGSHTVPHSVNLAWSVSSTIQPTTGMQTTAQYTNNTGHNLWVTYANGPTVAGTWYLWGIAYDTNGNVAATCVSPGFVFT